MFHFHLPTLISQIRFPEGGQKEGLCNANILRICAIHVHVTYKANPLSGKLLKRNCFYRYKENGWCSGKGENSNSAINSYLVQRNIFISSEVFDRYLDVKSRGTGGSVRVFIHELCINNFNYNFNYFNYKKTRCYLVCKDINASALMCLVH